MKELFALDQVTALTGRVGKDIQGLDNGCLDLFRCELAFYYKRKKKEEGYTAVRVTLQQTTCRGDETVHDGIVACFQVVTEAANALVHLALQYWAITREQ